MANGEKSWLPKWGMHVFLGIVFLMEQDMILIWPKSEWRGGGAIAPQTLPPPFPSALSKHPEVELLSLILSLSLCLFNGTKEDLSRRLEMKGKQKGFFLV